MKYRKLIDSDYSFGNNKGDFYEGVEAVAQAVKTRLKLLRGEWWEDVEDGVPLFEQVLGIPAVEGSLNAIDIIVKESAINTKGVLNITGFTSEFTIVEGMKKYNAKISLDTEFGEISNLSIE